MRSYYQQIRFLPSQFLLDSSQRVAVLDRHQGSTLTQPQGLDQPGQRLFGLLPDGTEELACFLSAARQGEGRNVILERSLVCVEEVEARLGKEVCCELYSRCRSVREINWDENPSVGGLIRIADDQNWSLNLLQQAFNGSGGECSRKRTPSVPSGHHKIDVMRMRPSRDGTGGISNADIDAIRQVAMREPSANLSLEVTLGVHPLCFDDRSRKFAVDDMKDS